MAPEAKFTFTNFASFDQIVFVFSDNTTRCKIHEHALLQRFPHTKEWIEAQRKDNPDKEVEFSFPGTKSTFEAFFQYIYTGTYDSPEPELVTHKTDSNDGSCPPKSAAKCSISNKDDGPKAAEQKKSCNSCHDVLYNSFRAKLSNLKDRLPNAAHYSRPNSNPYESYETVFKWHVDIYLLSRKKYPSLTWLAIYKLSQSLVSFQLHDQRLVDIVRLLEHFYGQSNHVYAMREILAHYAAIHVDRLWKNEDFVHLMRRNGYFAGDLMDILVHRRLLQRDCLLSNGDTGTDMT